jgi:transposase-like protein/Zn ribbon nucleic-acid-binding protein
MMLYPKNQIEFERVFHSEEDCISYLIKVRWINGFECPQCKFTDFWRLAGREIKCKQCGFKLSVTTDTIFHNSKIRLVVLFRVIWWIVAQKNGVSAKGVQRILGIGSSRTAWVWLHKFRRLMIVPGRDKLSGIIELDETYVGGEHEGKRGRGAYGKSIVLIAVEIQDKATGRVRLCKVHEASEKYIKQFVLENIERGATIITDGWPSYNFLQKEGFEHQKEAPANFDGEEILPNVHRTAALLKRWLIGTHQNYTTQRNLEFYLDEYTFRYNRRTSKSRGLLFYRLIEQAVVHKPILNADISSEKIKSV